jgi:SOS-response transcriptional repressor LexA
VEDGEVAAVLVDGDSKATLKKVRHVGDTILLMPTNPVLSLIKAKIPENVDFSGIIFLFN